MQRNLCGEWSAEVEEVSHNNRSVHFAHMRQSGTAARNSYLFTYEIANYTNSLDSRPTVRPSVGKHIAPYAEQRQSECDESVWRVGIKTNSSNWNVHTAFVHEFSCAERQSAEVAVWLPTDIINEIINWQTLHSLSVSVRV